MGVFPETFEIPQSKIFDFWVAEGFLKTNTTQSLEECANKYLKELDFNCLLVIHQRSTISKSPDIKTCILHSSLWHLCKKEAEENKFFTSLNIGLMILKKVKKGSADYVSTMTFYSA